MSYYFIKVLLALGSFFPIDRNSSQVSYTIHTNQQFKHTNTIVYEKAPTSLVKVFNN